MKLKFNANLDYQEEAINAIVDIFRGQEVYQSPFTVMNKVGTVDVEARRGYAETGYGNQLRVVEEDMLENVRAIQRQHHLMLSEEKEVKSREFCIEMETGTGKTYVYLRTMMELHEKHDFKKFIIVVPSVPIREGVLKSLEITKDHLQSLYNNVPYDYYVYDSKDKGQAKRFATNQHMQIMVMNIQAFNTEDRLINQASDYTEVAPIELIRQTQPIVIVDEPQSVANTEKGRSAIAKLNPLAIFNYSATHRRLVNLMYRLDAVAAYNRKLVKQIEVASVVPQGFYNEPYIKLVKVTATKSKVEAQLELHIIKNNKITTKTLKCKRNHDLEELTRNQVYNGNWYIKEIIGAKGEEKVIFQNGKIVTFDKPISGFPIEDIRRFQIRKTIEEHLEKERKLNKQGLKVLSLFFIDSVKNYRVYDDEGNPTNGEYARIFEEEYQQLIMSPQFRDLFSDDDIRDIDNHVSQVHNGYFSIDKKSKASNKKSKYEMYVDTSGKVKKDNDTYNLIMKDKEKLLSFESPLRFIFSHSALKEGWDNPNVFQICTLKEAGGSEIRRRQEIGRGLRLAVDQDGERIYGHSVNLLTVMASESYEAFASGLQQELEESTNSKFGIIDKTDFATINYESESGELVNLTKDESTALWVHLKTQDYIAANGKVKDELRKALSEENVSLPYKYSNNKQIKGQIYELLKRKAGSLEIKNKADRETVKIRKEVLLSPEFKELWNRVKYKTRFSVDYDVEKLKRLCIEKIQDEVYVVQGKLIYNKGTLGMSESGISIANESTEETKSKRTVAQIPDIVGYLQNEVNLTRKTIIDILRESDRMDMIRRNPQRFVAAVADIIKDVMSTFIVDGIKYEKIGDHSYYRQELFEEKEIQGFLHSNMIESSKSPHAHVIYDSNVESQLVKDMESSENVKLYTKLPNWFKVNTPLGTYNPDWAIVWQEHNEEKLYFVCETKGSLLDSQLKGAESAKIKCGRKHFAALDKDVRFSLATDLEQVVG